MSFRLASRSTRQSRRPGRFGTSIVLAACLFLAALLPARADVLQDASKLLKQGQAAQALEKTEQYLATKPKDAQGRFLKGLILTEMNRSPDAIAVFTKLTEDYPELPEPYNNLAVIYAQQKQYDKAKQALEMAIRTHPSYATAHENLGDIYARMASQAYDKALQIDSSNASAQTKLAMIRELMGNAARPTAKPGAAPSAPTVVAAVAPPQTKPVEEKPIEPKPVLLAPAAPPAAVTTASPESKAAGDASGDIARTLDAWTSAWSKKNVKAYLAFYARDFQTPGGEARAAWESERSKRINKPGNIQVSFEGLRVSSEGSDRASVHFRQHYRSASLKTSSNKVLTLVKRDGRWQIQQERVGK